MFRVAAFSKMHHWLITDYERKEIVHAFNPTWTRGGVILTPLPLPIIINLNQEIFSIEKRKYAFFHFL